MINGQPALCVAAYQGGDCLPNGLVVTLRPYTDPSAVLDRLLTKRVMVDGQPIFLSGTPEADMVQMKITPVGEAVYGDLRPLLELLPPVPQTSPLEGPIWDEPPVGNE